MYTNPYTGQVDNHPYAQSNGGYDYAPEPEALEQDDRIADALERIAAALEEKNQEAAKGRDYAKHLTKKIEHMLAVKACVDSKNDKPSVAHKTPSEIIDEQKEKNEKAPLNDDGEMDRYWKAVRQLRRLGYDEEKIQEILNAAKRR